MNPGLFSPRNLLCCFSLLLIVLGMVACGAPLPATEESPAESQTQVEEPASEPPLTPFPATATPEVLIPVTGGEGPAPLLPEYRRLTLEYPPSIKAGNESDVIRLTLEVDTLGNITPTAEFGGNVVEGEIIEIPNLYETHTIVVESYYDVAGLQVTPPGPVYQPLKQGEAVTYYWSVRANEVGTYAGTIWVFLNFEDRTTGEKERKSISAQVFEIKAVDFFGFSTNFVKTSGVVGSVLGTVVGFPFFKDIVKYLFERLTKGRRRLGKTRKK